MTPKTRFPCDLHCHTTRSDGKDTPEALIELAASLGMHAVAITDHDIGPPREIRGLPATEYAAERGVILVPGYEFSCDTQVDDVHICGYRMEWDHAELAVEVEAARRSKAEGYRKLCERLTDAGMPVDWDTHILHYTDASGKPAVRSEDEVQRKQIFEAMAELGHAPSWSDAKLMVRDNAKLNVKRRKIDPLEAIRLIHTCGGVAVLAHPYLIDESIDAEERPKTRHEYIDRLIEAGLDGIEARYTYDKTSYKGDASPAEIEVEIRSRYGERVRFLSGGSDYHGEKGSGSFCRNGPKGALHKRCLTPFLSPKVRHLGECGLTIDEFEKWSTSVK